MDSDPFPLSVILNPLLASIPLVTGLIYLVISFIFLFFVGLLNASEIAIFSLSAKQVNELKKKGSPSYRRVILLIEKPQRLLASMQLGHLIFSLLFVCSFLFSIFYFVEHFGKIDSLKIPSWGLLTFFTTIVLFVLLAFFGQVLPRVHAANNKSDIAVFSAPFLEFVTFLLGIPSMWLADRTIYLYSKMHALYSKEISTEELHAAIEEGRDYAATIEEVNIFKSILKFDKIQVKQIMKARIDITALDSMWSIEKVKEVIMEHGFSRMPVFEGNLDKIIGLIHTKDLLPHIDVTSFDWQSVMRKVLFVHETKFAESLLKEFQQTRNHIAIVVDEFGGTSGLVTLEDIMEEIIGDIQDEFDDDEIDAKKIDPSNFIFEGKTNINDACRFASLAVDTFDAVKGQSDSVAGLVLELAGRFPLVNEKISFGNYHFTVLKLENKRIQRIKLSIDMEEISIS